MEGYCRLVLLIVLVSAAINHRDALAAKHTVGGSQGWDQSTDFDSWASAQTFKVGDQLEFKYTSLHSVVELSGENAYKSCDIGTALNSFNGGSNTIKLDKAGTRYFACGTSGHCDQGMKVKITTVAADGSSSSSSSSSSTNTTPPSSSHGSAGGSTTTTTTSASSGQFHFFSFFALIASLVLSLLHFFA